MDAEAGMFFQLLPDLGALVRRIVIADQAQFLVLGRLALNLVQEVEPFGVTMADGASALRMRDEPSKPLSRLRSQAHSLWLRANSGAAAAVPRAACLGATRPSMGRSMEFWAYLWGGVARGNKSTTLSSM